MSDPYFDHIMFCHPDLERRFDRAVKSDEEVGGWFFIGWKPLFWPENYSVRRLRPALGQFPDEQTSVGFVNGFLMAPNINEDDRERKYRPWDWTRAAELAEASSAAYGGLSVQFHTHPDGYSEPSSADIAVASRYAQSPFSTDFAVVTFWPLRLHMYTLSFGTPAQAGGGKLGRSEYWSWRARNLRNFRAENGAK